MKKIKNVNGLKKKSNTQLWAIRKKCILNLKTQRGQEGKIAKDNLRQTVNIKNGYIFQKQSSLQDKVFKTIKRGHFIIYKQQFIWKTQQS